MTLAQRTDLSIAPSADKFLAGRGARSNTSGRFEKERRTNVHDGWWSTDHYGQPVKTEVTLETPKKIISTNQSPDISFSQSINPYRGCEHGCSYCYARPTHAFMNLSPGIDFESKLFAKPSAPVLLRAELSSPKYAPSVIAMGTNTDPYQPIEKHFRITRQVLETLKECGHPVTIVTKSHLVTRDIDILADMAKKNLTRVGISITTLDPRLARAMEPRAATPSKRLDAIEQLSAAGIPTTVMVAPVVPGLNDPEIENILKKAKQAGAKSAGYVMLRLPLEIRQLFEEWARERIPDRADRIIKLVKEMRQGRAYEAEWFVRQRGRGAFADIIAKRFHKAAKRLRLNRPENDLDTSQFRRPAKAGQQLQLL